MSKLGQIARHFINRFHLEFIFIYLGQMNSWFLKCVPVPEDYKIEEKRIVRRDGVCFELYPRDYMQWYVYAGIKDTIWQHSMDFISDESHVFDIGANIGAFSLKLGLALSKRGVKYKIIAFEPNLSVVSLFKRNLELNPELRRNVELYPIAIGAEEGEGFLEYTTANSGGGSITPVSHKGTVRIKVRTLDTLVAEMKISRLSFLKIDVEGYEPNVLKGAEKTISRFKPALYIEVTEKWYRRIGYSSNELFTYLNNQGYRIMTEMDSEYILINEPLPNIEQYNILAIHDK